MSCAARVAIVHYHLRLGGVTRVIQNALRALQPHDMQIAVLHGDEILQDTFVGRTARVPGLDYDSQCSPQDLLERLGAAAADVLGARPDIWHIHNHSLGKNLALAGLVDLMARKGEKLLLQIHDFPEDGRPGNYREVLRTFETTDTSLPVNTLYPCGSHVHYALLNSRDREFVLAAGAPETRAHLLPNPVDLGTRAQSHSMSTEPERILYPTRAIRRKNIGEFLLWAVTAQANQRFGITLEPTNPDARRVYDRWVQTAAELQLPVDFNLAADKPFTELVSQATTLVTTSVAEGFGLAFLEPWLMGRTLSGRNIPEITGDFSACGINLSGLYDALYIPLSWIGETTLRKSLEEALEAYYQAYSRQMPGDAVDRALQAACRDDMVDYGRLGEQHQEIVLRRLHASPQDRSAIDPSQLPRGGEAHLAANREAIVRGFSLSRYGERLSNIYAALAGSSADVPDYLSAELLLDRFLEPERFNLLRT